MDCTIVYNVGIRKIDYYNMNMLTLEYRDAQTGISHTNIFTPWKSIHRNLLKSTLRQSVSAWSKIVALVKMFPVWTVKEADLDQHCLVFPNIQRKMHNRLQNETNRWIKREIKLFCCQKYFYVGLNIPIMYCLYELPSINVAWGSFFFRLTFNNHKTSPVRMFVNLFSYLSFKCWCPMPSGNQFWSSNGFCRLLRIFGEPVTKEKHILFQECWYPLGCRIYLKL